MLRPGWWTAVLCTVSILRATEPIVTDRPTYSPAALVTVAPGQVQPEISLAQLYGGRTVFLQSLVKFGLANRLSLGFGLPGVVWNSDGTVGYTPIVALRPKLGIVQSSQGFAASLVAAIGWNLHAKHLYWNIAIPLQLAATDRYSIGLTPRYSIYEWGLELPTAFWWLKSVGTVHELALYSAPGVLKPVLIFNGGLLLRLGSNLQIDGGLRWLLVPRPAAPSFFVGMAFRVH